MLLEGRYLIWVDKNAIDICKSTSSSHSEHSVNQVCLASLELCGEVIF